MDEHLVQSRLSRMATQWTMLRRAHGDVDDEAYAAQSILMERYQRPIYRYLLASLRDADAADEVFQEFAVKFFKGGFRHADQSRGRFRDYLKTALARLITDYRRRLGQRETNLASKAPELQSPDGEPDRIASLDEAWRHELLTTAWEKLAEHERESGQPWYTVLRQRTSFPSQSSDEMARDISQQLRRDPPYTAAAARKSLQRARQAFADFLLDEVAASLSDHDLASIEEELSQLELLDYCRSAIQRRST